MTFQFEFRCLVVDDEVDLTDIISIHFRQLGIDHDVCNSATEARRMIQSKPYAAVLCDISMPDGNGLDIISDIRASGNDVPFVFLTAYYDADKIAKALKLGALDYLEKPIDVAKLQRVISNAMEIGRRPKGQLLQTESPV